VEFEDLLRKANEEIKQKPFCNGYFVTWMLKDGKINDLISIIKTSKEHLYH
jgi:hypothetical protein